RIAEAGALMKNMRIGKRILLGFGLVVGLAVALGVYALVMQGRAQKFNEEIDTRDARLLETLRLLATSETNMRVLREHALVNRLLARQGLPAGDPSVFESEWRQS